MAGKEDATCFIVRIINCESHCQSVALFFVSSRAVFNLADENYNGTFAGLLVFPSNDGELKGKSGERPALSP